MRPVCARATPGRGMHQLLRAAQMGAVAHLAHTAGWEKVVEVEAARGGCVGELVDALRVTLAAQRHDGDGLRFAAREHAAPVHARQQASLGAAQDSSMLSASCTLMA